MRKIADELNEAKREAESFAEVVRVYNSIDRRDRLAISDLIAPHRRFVREGELKYRATPTSDDEPHYLFLFNDLLLIARPALRAAQYPLVLMLDLTKVSDVVAPQDSDFVRHCMLIDTPRRSLMLLADSDDARDSWVRDLQHATASLRRTRSSRRVPSLSLSSKGDKKIDGDGGGDDDDDDDEYDPLTPRSRGAASGKLRPGRAA
eukprot:CAMPEP_0168586630 /NCGR_PEP_ID=MMETSP0420-20121227/4396_1 /TAXON_ID=498008 /ORGANISM="Pessonella sp." /LENGTH=204 /DNA_ID=CAMNT_0008621753 /DNA_START=749 /DNA_END=1360 /DNA_ORIENTATION=-